MPCHATSSIDPFGSERFGGARRRSLRAELLRMSKIKVGKTRKY